MLFYRSDNGHILPFTALQAHQTGHLPHAAHHEHKKKGAPSHEPFLHGERASSRTSAPGSVSLEAALLLIPCLLLFAWLCSFLELFYIQNHLQARMEQLSRRAALCRQAEENLSLLIGSEGEAYELLGEALYTGISDLVLEQQLRKTVERELSPVFCRTEEISVAGTALYRDREAVDLQVLLRVRLPVVGSRTVLLRSYQRVWSGNRPLRPEKAEDETVVYVTVSGSVFHWFRDCQHLTIHLKEVLSSQLPSLRNLGGGKYYPCEICLKGKAAEGTLYITTEGTRYHIRSTCPALKRTVREIPLSEAQEALRPCSTCQKRKEKEP